MADLQKLMPRRSFMAALAGVSGAAIVPSGLAASPTAANQTVSPGTAFRSIPLLSTYIAAAAQYADPVLLSDLQPGDVLVLHRRPDNAYDPRAVEVRTMQGQLLGYVPHAENQALCNLMDAGVQTTARIYRSVFDREHPDIRISIELMMSA